MTIVQDSPETAQVRSYAVLQAPPRRELLAVAELAARVCDMPMATVNLFTDSEQHQVATVGFDPSICRREDSMCALVLDADGPVIVPDTRRDPRFRDNPFVTGELGHVRFYAAHPLRTPTGAVVGTLCVFDELPRVLSPDQAGALVTLAERVVDVLELRLRSRQLTTSLGRQELIRGELEASNQRLTSLAGQISHDLKTPLASLAMALELARDGLVDGSSRETTLELLDRAIRGSFRMGAMIDGVLDYARLGGTLRLVDVDLDAVLDEVLVDLGDQLEGIAVRVEPLPTVRGDRIQLRALLQNLLSNAAKFGVPGVPPRITVAATLLRDKWRIDIIDNGHGVAPEDRERVFEPLVRADTLVEGSGIGLATRRRIVLAHHGEIGLSDAPGGGTVAWFQLPL